ncbi:hypothetical protein BJ508DRAFT_375871 [Ascobolus immersus RN42]|uniref:F-box domain-containing protein n=1 Tax=Ascobolus immersus RN42 TaxID=1160509 RepID=A0A3N4I7V2_ASCIM|nr:hypothetical protein BJ508DRAFT_375871 [Ascobolus immersus RN42]
MYYESSVSADPESFPFIPPHNPATRYRCSTVPNPTTDMYFRFGPPNVVKGRSLKEPEQAGTGTGFAEFVIETLAKLERNRQGWFGTRKGKKVSKKDKKKKKKHNGDEEKDRDEKGNEKDTSKTEKQTWKDWVWEKKQDQEDTKEVPSLKLQGELLSKGPEQAVEPEKNQPTGHSLMSKEEEALLQRDISSRPRGEEKIDQHTGPKDTTTMDQTPPKPTLLPYQLRPKKGGIGKPIPKPKHKPLQSTSGLSNSPQTQAIHSHTRPSFPPQTHGLLSLPNELLCEIISNLDSPHDYLSLSFVNRRLKAVGEVPSNRSNFARQWFLDNTSPDDKYEPCRHETSKTMPHLPAMSIIEFIVRFIRRHSRWNANCTHRYENDTERKAYTGPVGIWLFYARLPDHIGLIRKQMALKSWAELGPLDEESPGELSWLAHVWPWSVKRRMLYFCALEKARLKESVTSISSSVSKELEPPLQDIRLGVEDVVLALSVLEGWKMYKRGERTSRYSFLGYFWNSRYIRDDWCCQCGTEIDRESRIRCGVRALSP